MSVQISNADLQAVVGYIESYIALEGDCREDLKRYNAVRRAKILIRRLRKKTLS